jgi:DNA-directed RNA polymerase specialized sigma24 family protein
MSDAHPQCDSPQAWFIREILAHEAALMRFMRRVWPDQAEVEDLRQEVYVKVYEAGGG